MGKKRIIIYVWGGVVHSVACEDDTEIIVLDGDAPEEETGYPTASWPWVSTEAALREEHEEIDAVLREIDAEKDAQATEVQEGGEE